MSRICIGSIGRNGRNSAAPGHGEHVAEVRAAAHHDVLDDVGEGAPALEHALVEHAQIVLQSRIIGRGLLGDVDGAVDRDADIGGMQRRRIVDAVAEKADDVARAGLAPG